MYIFYVLGHAICKTARKKKKQNHKSLKVVLSFIIISVLCNNISVLQRTWFITAYFLYFLSSVLFHLSGKEGYCSITSNEIWLLTQFKLSLDLTLRMADHKYTFTRMSLCRITFSDTFSEVTDGSV